MSQKDRFRTEHIRDSVAGGIDIKDKTEDTGHVMRQYEGDVTRAIPELAVARVDSRWPVNRSPLKTYIAACMIDGDVCSR